MPIFKKLTLLKKEMLIISFILLFFTSAARVNAFDLSQFSFDIQPKIPIDGSSLSDYGIGFHYTEKISSEVRLNITEKRTNEKFSGVENSLNAVVHSEWKLFIIPFKYSFIKNEQTRFSAGVGAYYYKEKLDENGYFILTSLETPVNAYTNQFSMDLFAPAAEVEFSHKFSDLFQFNVSTGIVPFGFFNTKQTVNIIPLFSKDSFSFFNAFSYSQEKTGALSFHGMLTMSFFNLVDISGGYNGSTLTFDVIDFDSDYNVLVSEKKSYSQSVQVEGSFKVKFNFIEFNVGVGGVFSSVYLDSVLTTEGKRFYFVLGGKKVL